MKETHKFAHDDLEWYLIKYVIEDEAHAEWCGKFDTYQDAFQELKRRSKIRWDQLPNVCPCTNWKNCGRRYEIIEFEDSTDPWQEIGRSLVLEISSRGASWSSIATTP